MLKNIGWRVVVFCSGLVILFLSMTKVGLLTAQEAGVDSLKKNEVKFMIISEDGEETPSSYKFPETGMLPDNLMYGFKRIRDYIWLATSSGEGKIRLANLMADKKIIEFTELTKKDKTEMALEAGNEALDKLEYAYSLVGKLKTTDKAVKPLYQNIFVAGFAYKEVLGRAETKFSLENENYSKLISRINDWNKAQEKKKNNLDY